MRAYAIDTSDDVIVATLKALAPTDFHTASVFTIPLKYKLVFKSGTIDGAVTIADFHEKAEAILEPAFRALEKGFARLQGMAQDSPSDTVRCVTVVPRFPPEPYLVVTVLLESATGELLPQIGN